MVDKLRNKTKNAVTLTEILVAVVMLAVAGLPIFGLLNFSSRGTREQSAEAEAGNLAKEEMNRLMYVDDYNNLIKNPGLEKKDVIGVRKGNEFTRIYCIYPHKNSEIKFKVPKMKFHKPQLCNAGGETQDNVVGEDSYEEYTLKDLYPDFKDDEQPMLIDIYLEIKWKLPAEKDYSEKNKLVLYGRRYHTYE